MRRLLALACLALVGCATRATPPATVANTPPPPRTGPAPLREALQPINSSGEMSKQVAIDGGVITVGLVEHGPTIKVVRLAGDLRHPLFVAPLEVTGVPSSIRAFDYMIDPTANVDGDTSNRFTLVASGSDTTHFTYHVTWVFTWNSTRHAFEVAAPTVERQDRSICLPCYG